MTYQSAERILRKLLKYADIELNGSKAWDIQVHRKEFYTRVIKNPVLGLGETYMEGWWDCQALDEFFFRILRAPLTTLIVSEKSFFLYIFFTKIKLFFTNLINLQTPARALQVGKIHYDKGNFLYECMLDKRMNYSCGYWKTASTLDEAQEAKLELICQKLQLKPGMRVLDIGCGWGGFSKYAAENYGVSVVGITISREQLSYAKANCASLSVEFRFQDYRDLNEKFDRICSIGMFEHVGEKKYKNYFKVAHRCLSEDGLFLLHTIGSNVSQKSPNEWIHRYIFPNGILPSIAQIGSSIENLFVMEDWHNFGAFYDKTLQAWQMNFTKHYDVLKKHYDQRFFRMWNYYLLACAGAFRARDIQLWQVVLSKHGRLSGYDSVR